MYVVYWCEENLFNVLTPHIQIFQGDQLADAIQYMEFLRKANARFVAMSSENPNSVGKPGVDEVGKDYKWMKRRSQ